MCDRHVQLRMLLQDSDRFLPDLLMSRIRFVTVISGADRPLWNPFFVPEFHRIVGMQEYRDVVFFQEIVHRIVAFITQRNTIRLTEFRFSEQQLHSVKSDFMISLYLPQQLVRLRCTLSCRMKACISVNLFRCFLLDIQKFQIAPDTFGCYTS